MARFIFPAGSITANGQLQTARVYSTATASGIQLTEINAVGSGNEIGAPLAFLPVDTTGAYASFVGPNGYGTLYLEPYPGASRTKVTSVSATVEAPAPDRQIGDLWLTTGELAAPRTYMAGGAATSSGQMLLAYFTSLKSEVTTNITFATGGTAAAGLTLARVGLFTVSAAQDLTLLAASANDTALATATFTSYTKALTVPYTRRAGDRLAAAVLFVGTTMPTLIVGGGDATFGAMAPRLTGIAGGLGDLPATLTNASVSAVWMRTIFALT